MSTSSTITTAITTITTIASALLLLAGCPPPGGNTTTVTAASEVDSDSAGLSGDVITTSINGGSGSETSGASTSASSSGLDGDTSDSSGSTNSTKDTSTTEGTSDSSTSASTSEGSTTTGPELSGSSDGTSDATTEQGVTCQPGPKDTFGPCDADHECDGGICMVTDSGTMCSPPCEACMGGNQCVEDIGGLGPDNFLCTQSGNISMCAVQCVLFSPDVGTCQNGAVCDPTFNVCVWPDPNP